ncbi:MAG: AAA family ATPase [Thermoplasmata archaeon]|nr:AAA family ATPase [Thermoplasmata archaeon]
MPDLNLEKYVEQESSDLEEFRKQLSGRNRIFKPNGREFFEEKYLPSKLHHRSNEIKKVLSVLRPCVDGEAPNTLMVYGPSGTGKTAVLKHVGTNLEKIGKEDNKPISFVYINCSTMDTAYALFQYLGNFFTDEDKAKIPSTGWPFQAVLDKVKENLNQKERVIILALDEIDRLVKKSGDDPLHTLLTLQCECTNAKIGFVGISNDLRLCENFEQRVKSRLAGVTLTFNPYTGDQLKTILEDRAKQAFIEGKYRENEIALCAAIAAKESGDARRALRILRTAAEICESDGAERIEERHIYEAKNSIEKDVIKETIQKLRDHEKLTLYAVCLLSLRKESITTGSVYGTYGNLAKIQGMNQLSPRRITEFLTNMDELGLVSAYVQSSGRKGRTKQVELNIPLKETVAILEEDPLIKPLRQKLHPRGYIEKTLDDVKE